MLLAITCEVVTTRDLSRPYLRSRLSHRPRPARSTSRPAAVAPAYTTGVLVADLTCPTAAGQAIVVGDRATLDLAGHTLTGGGVICDRSCTVRGGTITG